MTGATSLTIARSFFYSVDENDQPVAMYAPEDSCGTMVRRDNRGA